MEKYGNAITCICFMGGDSEPDEVDRLAVHLRRSIKQPIKTAWYSGKQNIPKSCNLHNFDYIKLGAYIEELGGLDSPKTNQRLYKITNEQMEDITNHFQKQKQ
jgi:anaerobic ribonucleoside-triphosphate reductase activating protein